ncbi:MAG: hypothetical protein F4Z06_10765 [Acidimicrobiia bacterium]|nr:hypothetical protein [Acidimicrobiia bacterium]MYE72910.1 hypothetical protein [Acidimicrobiia bacterium]MYJ60853.1 hypothetical protein [Acidimicrobiia bacterium]
MSKKAGWAIAVLGTVGAGVIVGIVGTVVFRAGWTEPKAIEVAREAMQTFDHDSQHAHDEQDPFPHVYMVGEFFFSEPHRHCLAHDVNGDGDTADPEDNDGTCPGPDTGLPDSPWHPPLPDPGGPAKESALKYGVFLGAGTAGWVGLLLAVAYVSRTLGANRQARSEKTTKGPLWANALLGVLAVSLAAGTVGLIVSDARWADSKNSGLARNYLWILHHGYFVDHDDGFWHFYLDSDGRVDAELHRHCLIHDVNGDGDTEDPEDNDGTCPGLDTGVPDLAWHPFPPNPASPAGGDGLKEGALLAAATAITLTVILVAVGLPYAARRKRKLKLKEAAEAIGPPTTPTN